jgi:antitoxin ParD1/3/4
MPGIEKRSFKLPSEHAAFIDRLVASGAFTSGSEVVRAGLQALQERDAVLEQWLRDEVAPTYDATMVDPSSRIPADKVFEELRDRHFERLKSGV